jgi:hypothetical protein
MTRKKAATPRKVTLDKILSTVEHGFTAVAEDIADIKSKMATKEDLAELKAEPKTEARTSPSGGLCVGSTAALVD